MSESLGSSLPELLILLRELKRNQQQSCSILWHTTGRDSFAAFSKDSPCILYSFYTSTLFYHNTWIWRVKIYSHTPVWSLVLVLAEHCTCHMIRLQKEMGFLATSCVNCVLCIYCWLVCFWLDANTGALLWVYRLFNIYNPYASLPNLIVIC